MFEEADNFADIFRFGIPYYLLITLPILILCSSDPVLATDFSVHRMSQFDVNGVSYGCRSSALNLEAKSLYTWSTSRHCVVTRFKDLSIEKFREIRAKAGGLVILLPKNIENLNEEEKEHLFLLEDAMISQASTIPIYFSKYNEELDRLIDDITSTNLKNSKGQNVRESALAEIINSISANGYQITVTGASHSADKHSKIPIIQGELAPLISIKVGGDQENSNKLPIIVVVAHLKTFGLYNEYPENSDVAIVLSLADLFSKLHNSVTAAPKYRLMFLISESGALLNFQGTKKWLDENTQTQNIDFVLCLDTINQPLSTKTNAIYMHVSKPPKDNTPVSNFFKHLKQSCITYDNVTAEGVHKKINLADNQLAWEHERFSMKRLPAFTLSSLNSHKDISKVTSFKYNNDVVLRNAEQNVKILAEALAKYVYKIEENGEIFSGVVNIDKDLIKPWLQVKSILHNNDLKNGFEKYLKNVKIIYEKPDTREPDFMLYDGQEAVLNFYRIKPAVFDLFLTVIIAIYLTGIYFAIQYFPKLYVSVCQMSKMEKVKSI
ncbi:BOS complex subunit ncln [Condylostylus longicornis]|uniref:BOS complex subunit ncln n=1 Tax=Condylostylus longicornis TaxID=2530218 RepID=UPI00244DC9AD|nr:BOS complex subunit ncln [Condylostylus longicornis]